jgi:anthranilate synthase/aminodeoxychorismate synthase-like glutamine amidotransferase
MLLMIDNFDSFTYNLVDAFRQIGSEVCVMRNNALTVEACLELSPCQVVISPGPGNPSQAGICNSLITACAGKIPVLGICLGHQCIAQVFGGRVIRAKAPRHGKTSCIYHTNKGMFTGRPDGFMATRYHSLIVERETFPSCLEITAETEEGEIMGLRHRSLAIEGVQFHPESILTSEGMALLKTFINNN